MAFKKQSYNKKSSSTVSDDTVIELDKKKQITVRKFNNINLIDIREFYVDKETNEKKPGKKGISLTEDCWLKLLESATQVQDALDRLNGVDKKRRAAAGEDEDEDKPSKKLKSEPEEEAEKDESDADAT